MSDAVSVHRNSGVSLGSDHQIVQLLLAGNSTHTSPPMLVGPYDPGNQRGRAKRR